MRNAIYSALNPVRVRQQRLFALRCAAVGLLGAGLLGAAIGAVRLVFGFDVPSSALGLLAVGPAVGLLFGFVARRSWHQAAVAVDTHYGLKDRTVTALAFATTTTPSAFQDLQFADATAHLTTLDPKAVVPLKAPRSLPAGLAALAAAVLALAWPAASREVEAGPAPVPEHILTVAAEQKLKLAGLDKKLSETAQDVEDEKGEDAKKGIKELLDKLAQKVEEMTQPGTDEREALAKLSEMQAEVQAMANQLNVAAMDGQLSSLGTALAASTAFEGAGKALQEGKLEKAAKDLEKIDEVKLTPKEAKALEEKLKQLAKQMGDAGQGSLSEAVSELADSLKGGNGKVGDAARNLAKKLNNAVKRKKLNDLLTAQLEDLKEGKCNCQNSGGLRVKQTQKSNSPSNTWGRTSSGNVDGEKTKLNSKRNELQLTGTPGAEGESDVETMATPEARQQASREYKEKFQKFKKESEAVVEGEPIPLGHRQTVKKYFELIRPSNSDPVKPTEQVPAGQK